MFWYILNLIIIVALVVVIIFQDYKKNKLLKCIVEQKETSLRLEETLSKELSLTQKMMNDFLINFSKIIEKNKIDK